MLSPRRKSRLPDLLDRIREELNARLDELRSRVDEHGRLEAAMHALASVRLGPTSTASASAPVKTTKARAQKMPPAKRRKRAPRGANRQAVLRAASERPGATSGELAGVSGVEPNTLSGLLGRLVKAGELQTRALPTVYEVATFQVLRDALRCKEIWVAGADRWRDPDDLPADYAARRVEHYRSLRKPMYPSVFVDELREQMHAELGALNDALPKLGWLEIAERRSGAIRLTPLAAQPEPRNLRRVKAEVLRRWGTVPLVDMLKETVLRTGCLDTVTSVTTGGSIRPDVLAERLLLAIYAYDQDLEQRQPYPAGPSQRPHRAGQRGRVQSGRKDSRLRQRRPHGPALEPRDTQAGRPPRRPHLLGQRCRVQPGWQDARLGQLRRHDQALEPPYTHTGRTPHRPHRLDLRCCVQSRRKDARLRRTTRSGSGTPRHASSWVASPATPSRSAQLPSAPTKDPHVRWRRRHGPALEPRHTHAARPPDWPHRAG
jgi:hypothetical protein